MSEASFTLRLCLLSLAFAGVSFLAAPAAQAKVYFTSDGEVWRADLDGSNEELLVEIFINAGWFWGIALDPSGGKMYWTGDGPIVIRRSNLDGSNIEELIDTGSFSTNAWGIALDVSGGKMYWTDVDENKIRRANLNGSGIEDLVDVVGGDSRGIALDLAAGKMYWTAGAITLENGKILRADLDGSNVEVVTSSVCSTPSGIAIDLGGGKMYWACVLGIGIQRANLDGSAVETVLEIGNVSGQLDVGAGKIYFATDPLRRSDLDGSNVEELTAAPCCGTEAVALDLSTPLVLRKSAAPNLATSGGVLVYTLTVTNNTGETVNNISLSDVVPALTTYQAGSASDGGSETAGVVSWPVFSMVPSAIVVRTFAVTVGTGLGGIVAFSDDMDGGSGNWTTTHAAGTVDWVLDGTMPNSGSFAWFGNDVAGVSDQFLVLTSPVTVPPGGELSFSHKYQTESGFDGGVVEISADGSTWTDLGSLMIQNGYNDIISADFNSPIGGRPAFSGFFTSYIETMVDLDSFAGTDVRFRFRMATDTSFASIGWFVDDVVVSNGVLIENDAQVTSDGATAKVATVVTRVPEPSQSLMLGAGLLVLAGLGRQRW